MMHKKYRKYKRHMMYGRGRIWRIVYSMVKKHQKCYNTIVHCLIKGGIQLNKQIIRRLRTSILTILLAFSVAFVPIPAVSNNSGVSESTVTAQASTSKKASFSIKDVPEYDGNASVEMNGNKPYFTAKEKEKTYSFESYHKLDKLGRCGVTYANVSKGVSFIIICNKKGLQTISHSPIQI